MKPSFRQCFIKLLQRSRLSQAQPPQAEQTLSAACCTRRQVSVTLVCLVSALTV